MLGKCSIFTHDALAECATLHLDVWSLRSAAASLAPLPPAVRSLSFHGLTSVRHGPQAVVTVAGQLEPLVRGRAGLRRHPPRPPLPLGGGTGAVGNSGGDDAEPLHERRRSHALASTSTGGSTSAGYNALSRSSSGAWGPPVSREQADAAQAWARPSRDALLRLDRPLSATGAAVRLLRIAHESHPLAVPVTERPAWKRPSPAGPDPHPSGEATEVESHSPSGRAAGPSRSAGRGAGAPSETALPPTDPAASDEPGLGGGLGDAAELRDLERFLVSGPLLQPQPQQGEEQRQWQRPARPAQLAAAESRPPLELLAGLDCLALWEAVEALQPLLPGLSVAQLQRCLETLAAIRYVPADPWFHDWLLASEQQLQRADATEVYGMLVAMRVLRLRPQSSKWVGGAMSALAAHLAQLDAVQVVELLGCFADMALRPRSDLLARAFALLQPDLPQLQPRVVLDLLCSCSRLRVAPPPHALAAAFGALTPTALAVAPPTQLCRLAAALAAMRLQLPLGLQTALVARSDALLRSAVATAAAAAAAVGDVNAEMGQGGEALQGSSDVGAAAAAAAGASSPGPAGAAAGGAGPRTLQPRRGKAKRAAAAAAATDRSAGAAEGSPSVPAWSPSLAPPPPSALWLLTPTQLSCLLRDLRLLQAPLPSDWGDLCGRFLVGLTDSSTPVLQVSYLLRSIARCGLSLPPVALRVVTARLEVRLRLCAVARRRVRRQRAAQSMGGGEPEVEGAEAMAHFEEGGEDMGGGGGGGGFSDEVDATTWPDSPRSQWTAQDLSMTTMALVPYAAHLQPSLLRALYDNLYETLERFDLPELTATLHALPQLAAPPRPRARHRAAAAAAAGRALPAAATTAEPASSPPPPPPALVASYLSCLRGRMQRMQPWQLSMCIFALLRLRARPEPAWMDAFLGQVYGKLPYMNEVQVASVAWVVAKMSYRPRGGWVERLLRAAAGRLSCFSPRHLSQLLWAVGALGYRPGGPWMARWLDKARAHFRTSDGDTLAALAWAVAALRHAPGPDWLQDLCEHLARRLPYTSPRAVANALAAFADLGHRPDPAWLAAFEEHVLSRLTTAPPGGAVGSPPGSASATLADGGCYSLRDLSQVCLTLARLRCSPSDGWLDAVATAAGRLALLDPPTPAPGASTITAFPHLGSGHDTDAADVDAAAAAAAHAKHVALLMLALARLRRRPPPAAWSALLEGLYPCLPYASPQALSVLLASAAALRLRLPAEHAGALLLATHRRMGACSGRGLALAFRGFVELGVNPGPRWLGRLEEVLQVRREERERQERILQVRQRLQQEAQGLQGGGLMEEEREPQEEGEGVWEWQLTPRERSSMLWAAVTLETARLEELDAASAETSRRGLNHRRRQQQQQQQQPQLQQQGALGAVAHPPPPRWVWKLGPLQRPPRLAGLISLLLPALEPPSANVGLEDPRSPAHGDGAGFGDSDDGGVVRQRRSVELAAYSGQDLALTCWALGRLRMRPRGLVSALLDEVSERLAEAEAEPRGQDAAASTVAVARGDAGGGERAAASAEVGTADAGVRRLAPHEMAMAFWGLSSVGVRPSAAWRATAAAAALRAARGGGGGGGMSPSDLSTVLLALARWQREPRAGRGSPLVGPLSRRHRGAQGQEAALEPRGETPEEVRLRACTAALVEFALADSAANMTPPPSGAAAAAGGNASTARSYDARSLATLAWAVANLGVVRRLPDPWVAALMPGSLRLLSQLPAPHRVTLLDSLSRLGLRPGRAWIDAAEQVVLEGALSLASSFRGLEAALRRMADDN